MRHIGKFFCFFLCIAIPCIYMESEARKIRTKLPVKTNSTVMEDTTSNFIVMLDETDNSPDFDSISHLIKFYGFDKTLSSNVESFFIVNPTDLTITHLSLTLTYNDLKGRLLHRRDVDIDCEVPPGETRRIDTKTWDSQKAFYYHRSAKPKRQASPFDVSIRLKSVALSPVEPK